MARRLAGRSVGVVLSGGGARAFAHLGALEVLLDAGLLVDRVGGVSMGAFVGGPARGRSRQRRRSTPVCYEEWVRRNPINDYTIPRSSLIKGQKAEAMLERVFGDVRLEELSRSFYCASVNLRGNSLVIDRDGPMAHGDRSEHRAAADRAADAPRGEPADRRLAARQPAAGADELKRRGTGAGDRRQGWRGAPAARADGRLASGGRTAHAARRRRLPSLPETMARVALLSSANTDESARRYADMTIAVRVSGVGLLEFHQIDEARAAGRRAALAALEDAPEWLRRGRAGTVGPVGRRTVLRV